MISLQRKMNNLLGDKLAINTDMMKILQMKVNEYTPENER